MSAPSASLSSSEINLLIQHYLQELGYDHAAFAFACESKIPKHPIAKRDVPPGALVYLVQKGILFCDIESVADASIQAPSSSSSEIAQLKRDLRQMEDEIRESCEASKTLRLIQDPDSHEHNYLNDRTSLILVGHRRPVTAISWSTDDRYLATGAVDGRVVVWETDGMEADGAGQILDKPSVISTYSKDITCLKWTANAESPTLLVGTFSGKLVHYDAQLNELWSLTETDKPIVSISVASNIAVGDSVGNVYAVDPAGVVMAKWQQEGELVDVFWRNEKSLVAAIGDTVYAMEMDNPEPSVLIKTKSRISQMIIDNAQNFLVVGEDAGFVTIFDLHKNEVVMEHQSHATGVCSLSFAAEKNLFATGGSDGFVKLYDIDAGDETVFEGHAKTVYLVTVDPSARYIATAGAEEIINVWSTETRQMAFGYQHAPAVQMTWSTTGTFLTIALENGSVALVDTRVLNHLQ